MTVKGKEARDEAMARVRRALLEHGHYELPIEEPEEEAVPEVPIANLETASLAWLRWKETRCTAGSCEVYTQHARRLFAAVRKIRGVPKSNPIGVDLLSRDLVTQAVLLWQKEGLSESTVYGLARSVLELWRWASDDPAQWHGVPTPPREPKALLPRPPIYVAPPAPTLAEADACLRYLPLDATQSRRIGTFMRFTGLRVHQVAAIRRQDLDLEARTLTITTGKSRAEKAAHRTVPIARHLLNEIGGWVAGVAPGGLLFPRWGLESEDKPASIRPELFRAAWEEATRFNEAREIAWKPANRKTGRPEHAFRACFQAVLRELRASEEVIDALVGYQGRSTRDRHYAGHDSLLDRMREAVDGLPPIDWRGPTVMSLDRRRRKVTSSA